MPRQEKPTAQELGEAAVAKGAKALQLHRDGNEDQASATFVEAEDLAAESIRAAGDAVGAHIQSVWTSTGI